MIQLFDKDGKIIIGYWQDGASFRQDTLGPLDDTPQATVPKWFVPEPGMKDDAAPVEPEPATPEPETPEPEEPEEPEEPKEPKEPKEPREGTKMGNLIAGGGMAVVAGVIFPAPLLQHLHLSRAQDALKELGVTGDLRSMPWEDAKALLAEHSLSVPPIDIPTMIIVCLAGALIGYGFVGLATRKFLTDPTLPAPEARACETMIATATADSSARPRLGLSLVLGLTASFLAPLLSHIGAAKEHVLLYTKEVLNESGDVDRVFKLDLPFTPIYIGIGGLLTLATALLVFAGSFLRLIGDWALASIDPSNPLAADFPSNSMRWVGGGAMTVAVAYSLVKFMGPRVASAKVRDAGSRSLARA